MDSEVVIALIISIIGNIINAWGMIAMKIGHQKANLKKLRKALASFTGKVKKETPDACEVTCQGDSGHHPVLGAEADREANRKAKEADGSGELTSGFLKEPYWWLGMAIYAVGSLMHVASLGFGPAALLHPMEGLTLVANALSSPFLLSERFTVVDIIGTVVIIGGVTMVVIFGPQNEDDNSMDELLDRFDGCSSDKCDYAFLYWSGAIWSVTILAFIGSLWVEYTNRRDKIRMDGSLKPRGAIFLAFTYSNIKGVMGGYTMLFGKIAVEALTDGNNFDRWETYVFVLVFVAFNVGMEYWRQKALNLFSTMYVVPLMQVSLVIFSVITGGIFFTEFNSMETYKLALFSSGVAVICVGVAILSADTESRSQLSPIKKFKVAIIAVWAAIALRNLPWGKDPWGFQEVGIQIKKNDEEFVPTPNLLTSELMHGIQQFGDFLPVCTGFREWRASC